MTAIPGAAVLTINVLKTDQKAHYFFKKMNQLNHILYEYKFFKIYYCMKKMKCDDIHC